MKKKTILQDILKMCPGSSCPFYIKWVTTSWTHSRLFYGYLSTVAPDWFLLVKYSTRPERGAVLTMVYKSAPLWVSFSVYNPV